MSLHMDNFKRILNFPMKIHWDGWQTDTFELQRAGWSISAEQPAHMLHSIRFALKHPSEKIYAVTNPVDVSQAHYTRGGTEALRGLVLEIAYMANRVVIHTMDNVSRFQPVDGTPELVDVTPKDLAEFNIFRPLQRPQDIILEPADVNAAMDIILKYQSPKQKEIREKKQREWNKFCSEFNKDGLTEHNAPSTQVIAQLITI